MTADRFTRNELRSITDYLVSKSGVRPHYTSLILYRIRQMIRGGEISIDNHQQNAGDGVHQCRVRLEGDSAVYRMILAPADAPITLYGRPVGEAFAKPLGDG